MKRIGSLMLVLALLLAVGPVAAFAAEWTGVITETHCGAAHKAGTDKDIQCIKECVSDGRGKLALLVDIGRFKKGNTKMPAWFRIRRRFYCVGNAS